ncbi:MAG: tRNA (N6-threonylcarbamoyladenosine(37)-N6)-methyltransferase TrmO [Candidatus Odinarchaeia archaeon]
MIEIKLRPIGVLKTPFTDTRGVPIQSIYGEGIEGVVEIFPEYIEGLKDLAGFSHIILIYYFHLSKKCSLKVKPYLDNKERGVFATRAPSRPNPIGISIVRLIKVEENKLKIKDVDICNMTPILDIKPYIPDFDIRKTTKIGWLENQINKAKIVKGDGRFS